MTCMTLDRFKTQGFDIFDAYGHRVLNKDEAKRREMCATNPRLAGRGPGWMCTRNFAIMIPAHTCITFRYKSQIESFQFTPSGTDHRSFRRMSRDEAPT
jgi:hypothetical protein